MTCSWPRSVPAAALADIQPGSNLLVVPGLLLDLAKSVAARFSTEGWTSHYYDTLSPTSYEEHEETAHHIALKAT